MAVEGEKIRCQVIKQTLREMLFLPLPQAELQSNTSPPPFPVPNFPVLIFTACCPRSLPVPWVRWQVTQEVWVGAQRFFSADPCHPPLLCLVWVLLGAAPTLGFRGSPPAACWRVPGGRACSILCIAVVPPIKDPPPFPWAVQREPLTGS